MVVADIGTVVKTVCVRTAWVPFSLHILPSYLPRQKSDIFWAISECTFWAYPFTSSVGCLVWASQVGKDIKYRTSFDGLPDFISSLNCISLSSLSCLSFHELSFFFSFSLIWYAGYRVYSFTEIWAKQLNFLVPCSRSLRFLHSFCLKYSLPNWQLYNVSPFAVKGTSPNSMSLSPSFFLQ